MGQSRTVHLKGHPGYATQRFAVTQNFLGHIPGVPNQKGSQGTRLRIELIPGYRSPSPFLANFSKSLGIARVKGVERRLGVFSQVAQGVETHLKVLFPVAGTQTRFAVHIHQGTKTVGFATNNGHGQGQTQFSRPFERSRRTAYAQPNGQVLLYGPRINGLLLQSRAKTTRPTDGIFVPYFQKQIQLLGKELIVVVQTVAKQGKGIDEGAAAHDHFGPPFGNQIEGGKFLKNPYRIVGAEYGNRTSKLNLSRSGGSCRQNYGMGRVHILLPMVLAHSKKVEAHLIGQFHPLQQLLHGLHALLRPLLLAAYINGSKTVYT